MTAEGTTGGLRASASATLTRIDAAWTPRLCGRRRGGDRRRCSSGGHQDVRSGAGASIPQRTGATTTSPVSTVVAPPPPFDKAARGTRRRAAPAGKLVGRAPAAVVDDVELRRAVRVRARGGIRTVRSARRIKITGGPFPYGDARVLVLVDGRSIGEGQVADHGRTLTAAVFEPALIHAGRGSATRSSRDLRSVSAPCGSEADMASLRRRITVAVLAASLLATLVGASPSSASRSGHALPVHQALAPPTPDPGLPGPLHTSVSIYDFGDSALTFPGFPGPVEDRAVVWRPNLSGGPFPLVILLHGRHEFCVSGFQWPCRQATSGCGATAATTTWPATWRATGTSSRPSARTASTPADGGLPDGGADARGRLIMHHLDHWKVWSTTGGAPYGSLFVGKVDLSRVGLMGHSRGGEGVAYAIQRNQSLGSPYGIKAAMLIGPVDFTRRRLHGVSFGVILPYCDGTSPISRAFTTSTTRCTSSHRIRRTATPCSLKEPTTTSSTPNGRRRPRQAGTTSSTVEASASRGPGERSVEGGRGAVGRHGLCQRVPSAVRRWRDRTVAAVQRQPQPTTIDRRGVAVDRIPPAVGGRETARPGPHPVPLRSVPRQPGRRGHVHRPVPLPVRRPTSPDVELRRDLGVAGSTLRRLLRRPVRSHPTGPRSGATRGPVCSSTWRPGGATSPVSGHSCSALASTGRSRPTWSGASRICAWRSPTRAATPRSSRLNPTAEPCAIRQGAATGTSSSRSWSSTPSAFPSRRSPGSISITWPGSCSCSTVPDRRHRHRQRRVCRSDLAVPGTQPCAAPRSVRGWNRNWTQSPSWCSAACWRKR